MNRRAVEQSLATRLLAKQFATKIKEIGARSVLVTSVEPGAGKTSFVRMIRRESALVGDQQFVPIETKDLYTTDPEFFEDHVIVADGPAFLEERGLYVLPEQWLLAFDAAVVVVSLRETRATELRKAVKWLTDYGIPHVYLVCNLKNLGPTGAFEAAGRASGERSMPGTREVNNV